MIPARQQQLVDSLIMAVEGGINYWAYSSNYEWGSENGRYELGDNMYASVTLQEIDNQRRYDLTPEIMATGWNRIMQGQVKIADYIKRYMEEDNLDAETADCIVQASLFNEIIFG